MLSSPRGLVVVPEELFTGPVQAPDCKTAEGEGEGETSGEFVYAPDATSPGEFTRPQPATRIGTIRVIKTTLQAAPSHKGARRFRSRPPDIAVTLHRLKVTRSPLKLGAFLGPFRALLARSPNAKLPAAVQG